MDIKINEYSVVVFDLDDTLYNELEYLKSAYKAIAKHLELGNWKSLYSFMFSLYRCKENVFNILAKTYNVDINMLIEMYRNHSPEIQLFEGVLDILKNIKANNGKLGIITDGRVKTQLAKIKALGIDGIFDKIIISEALGTEKPNKANFKAIESVLFGSNYYYIADNYKKDFIAPNSLGWNTIGLMDNGLNIHHNAHQYFSEENRPKQYLMSYHELEIS